MTNVVKFKTPLSSIQRKKELSHKKKQPSTNRWPIRACWPLYEKEINIWYGKHSYKEMFLIFKMSPLKGSNVNDKKD